MATVEEKIPGPLGPMSQHEDEGKAWGQVNQEEATQMYSTTDPELARHK